MGGVRLQFGWGGFGVGEDRNPSLAQFLTSVKKKTLPPPFFPLAILDLPAISLYPAAL